MRWRLWPQRVRTRLALLYAVLFLVSGSALLGLTYGLVAASLPATSPTAQQGSGFDRNQLAKLRVACKLPHPDVGTVAACKRAFSAGSGSGAASVRALPLNGRAEDLDDREPPCHRPIRAGAYGAGSSCPTSANARRRMRHASHSPHASPSGAGS